MLIKGETVVFKMADGTTKKCPESYGIVHDPDGKVLPRCVVYVGPVKRTEKPVENTGKVKAYFGRKYNPRQAIIDRPPSSWQRVGEVVEILYVRRGRYAGSYFHPFAKFSPTLSKSGRWYKLELRDGCIYDDRGFVFP